MKHANPCHFFFKKNKVFLIENLKMIVEYTKYNLKNCFKNHSMCLRIHSTKKTYIMHTNNTQTSILHTIQNKSKIIQTTHIFDAYMHSILMKICHEWHSMQYMHTLRTKQVLYKIMMSYVYIMAKTKNKYKYDCV